LQLFIAQTKTAPSASNDKNTPHPSAWTYQQLLKQELKPKQLKKPPLCWSKNAAIPPKSTQQFRQSHYFLNRGLNCDSKGESQHFVHHQSIENHKLNHLPLNNL
jgi:hypothetical protein